MSDSEAFTKWLEWAKVNTNMFTQFSTDDGVTWGYLYKNPEQVAHAAWQAAIEHSKKNEVQS